MLMSAVAVSPDGDLVASAAFKGELRLWSRKAGRVVAELANATDSAHDSVTGLAFTPDGKTLLLDYESQLDIWPVERLLAAHKK